MALHWAKYILIGGSVFWLTDACFMIVNGIMPARVWIVAKTILLPLALVMTVRALVRKAPQKCSPAARSHLLLAGIWMLGPAYSALLNRICFKTGMSLGEAVFQVALFPLSTIVIATYSGALGGLIVATIYLVLFGFFSMHRE